MKNYSVSGYKMTKNNDTWEMEKHSFVSHILVNSQLVEIDTYKDRDFFEGEISMQLNCDWFEIVSFQPIN